MSFQGLLAHGYHLWNMQLQFNANGIMFQVQFAFCLFEVGGRVLLDLNVVLCI